MKSAAIISLAFVLVLFGSGAQGLCQDKPFPSVKVGHLGIMGDFPFYADAEKGFFKEQGIKLELEEFGSAAGVMAPLAGNKLQVAGGGISLGLFNSFARGWPVRIVAARAIGGNYYMVRADLKDQITRPRDLKGRKVAANAPGSVTHYLVAKALDSDGLSLKDVELVFMGFPDLRAAFINRAIDVAMNVEPFTTFLVQQKVAVIWKRDRDFLKVPLQTSVVFFNKDWADKSPEVAKNFMVAYIKAARYYYDAMVGKANRAEVINILTRHTRVKDKSLYDLMRWSAQDPNGTILAQSIEDTQEWLFRNGLLKQKVKVEDMVDETYLKYAINLLGTVPCELCGAY